MVQGHILKFLERQQPSTIQSRRLFPQQKCGHSKESPDWFKRKFSLQPTGGYEYRHDESNILQKFKYQSQRNHFFVNKGEAKIQPIENAQIRGVNNLKKGLLSEYLDNNAWMKATVPITGFQRNEESRRMNSRDIQKNIETNQLKKNGYIAARTASNFYSTNKSKLSSKLQSRQIKTSHQAKSGNFFENPNPEYCINVTGRSVIESPHTSRSKSIPTLMSEKEKIRTQRLQLVVNKLHKIQKVKISEKQTLKKLRTIDSQFVEGRMTLTARQWGGRKASTFKSIQRFDEMIGWKERSEGKSLRGFFNNRLSAPIQPQNMTGHLDENKFFSNQL